MTVALFETLLVFFSPICPIRYLLSQREAPRAHTHTLSGNPPAKQISSAFDSIGWKVFDRFLQSLEFFDW